MSPNDFEDIKAERLRREQQEAEYQAKAARAEQERTEKFFREQENTIRENEKHGENCKRYHEMVMGVLEELRQALDPSYDVRFQYSWEIVRYVENYFTDSGFSYSTGKSAEAVLSVSLLEDAAQNPIAFNCKRHSPFKPKKTLFGPRSVYLDDVRAGLTRPELVAALKRLFPPAA